MNDERKIKKEFLLWGDNPHRRSIRLATKACLSFFLLLMTTQSATSETLYEGLPAGPGRILEDRDGQIYVAVFAPSDGIIIRRMGDNWETWHQGPVHGLEIAPDGDIWVARDNEIMRYPGPVMRTLSFQPQGTPGPLLATRWGDLWCAACNAVRRGDAMFEAAPPSPPGWTITPCCDDPFGNLWAIAGDGRRNDLAVLNQQQPHVWRLIELPSEQTAGPWAGVVVDDSGFVWVGLQQAVLRVDPRSAIGQASFASPVESAITAIVRIASRQIAAGFADGSVRELTVVDGQAPQWHTIVETGPGPVQALLHDRAGDLWILAGGQVLRVQTLRAPWHANWDEQPRMPAGNHDHIFARIDDRLYTAGGKTFFGMPADEWVNLDHVWSYSISDGTWRVEPPMLEPGKAYSGIAALAGELWLLGGHFRDETARHGTRATATVEIYDPRSRRFHLGPPLPQPGAQIVALTVDDRIYAIGGDDQDGPLSEVISIAAGETEWSRRASAPGPVSQASGCVLDGKIYVAAGPSSQCPGLFVYDPQQDRWSQVEHPASRAPSAPLCTAFAGEVWVMGGRGEGAQTTTYIYSPDSGQWRQGPDIPLPASWAAAADVDGRLLIAGGAYEDDRVGTFFNTDRVFLLRGDQ